MPPKLHYPNLDRDLYVTGSAMDWGRALPATTRLLVDRRADVALPAPPLVRSGEEHDVTFNRALAYWTALGHLLRLRLGWTHPAQGLARWLDGPDAPSCAELDLVRHVWLGDWALLLFMAWRLENVQDHVPSHWKPRIAPYLDHPDWPGSHTESPWGDEGRLISPRQLHLTDNGGHTTLPEFGEPPTRAWLEPSDMPGAARGPATAKAPYKVLEPVMLFRGSLETGWYAALRESPAPAVRVLNEQFGLVGTFRCSPTSGRWHSVPEDVHLWGARPG